MAIALVKAGAISTVTTTSVTPAFGQATGTGNLLVALVCNTSAQNISTSSTGWAAAGSNSSGTGSAVFFKANSSSGESAPTFTVPIASGTTYAILAEFSGAATSSPVDKDSGFHQNLSGSTLTETAGAADSTSSDLAVCGDMWLNSKTATYSFGDSWTPAGGSAGVLGDTGATKAATAARFSYYLLNGNGGGSADSLAQTCTPSTGTLSSASGAYLVSFKPPAVAAVSLIPDTRRVQRNILLRR